MEPVTGQLDLHSNFKAFKDNMGSFEIWIMLRKDVKDDNVLAAFLIFIGQDAYSLPKTLIFPDKLILLPYSTLKELLLNHVRFITFERRGRVKFHKMIRQDNQKVREFVLELQKQAAKCSFDDQLLVQLHYRLIDGINIPNLENKLI
ncbi:unnamed protein product [Schistosoma curassoni]|uniref:Uncharacterized protein n=1 Tax=Schistosoma curassoni TaxID=6186 RepID=A0A183K0T3_9TREM|nr:unnamed protein product [Schistosoma curassoni]